MSTRSKPEIVVAIVAPGFPPSKEVQKQIKSFTQRHREFEFRLPKNLIRKNPMFANDEARRAQFLVDALRDDSVDIIWCLRGGYGSLPVLKFLAKMKAPKKQKLLVGLSDITSLHIFLNQSWGWSSLHASNLDRWIQNRIPKAVFSELLGILNGQKDQSHFRNIKPINELAKKLKSITGQLLGGNLVTLTSHLGTPFQPSFKGKFLFIEEIGERAYKIDRCLMQLSLSGVLKGCRGVLIGQFTSCLEPDGKKLWLWTVKQWAKDLGIPVYSGVPSGHDVNQWPLMFGTRAEIKIVNDRRVLIIENKKR